jgi:hypothetical protein
MAHPPTAPGQSVDGSVTSLSATQPATEDLPATENPPAVADPAPDGAVAPGRTRSSGLPVGASRSWWPGRRWPAPARADLLALAVFLLGGMWVTLRLWSGSGSFLVAASPDDEDVFEWFLAHGARWVTHGGNPLFSHQILLPDGANMMVNTSILGLSVPLAPLTLTLGVHATFVLAIGLSLSATGYAWYHVLSRHLVRARFAAFLGGAVCGFGPGMVAHASGQLDLVANFLVPFIALRTVRLREPGRALRNGVLLGLLVAYQVMIDEEVLFITGVTIAAFVLLYAAQRPRQARADAAAFLRGLAVAGLTTVIAVGYPLWFQFFGPRHVTGLMPGAASWITPLSQFVSTPPSSIGGNPTFNNASPSYSEYNTFFGWSLLALLLLAVAWQRRDPLVRALAGAAALAWLISLGKGVAYLDREHALGPGPFRVLAHLPLFDRLSPSRFALAAMMVVGVLVALTADRWATASAARGEPSGAGGLDARTVRRAGYAAVCLALLPLVPTPVMVQSARPVPTFVTTGAWRDYVGQGQSVVAVPLPMYAETRVMRWSTATRLDLPLAMGYMLGPIGADGSQVDFNPPPRPLVTLLNRAARDGAVPARITSAQRQAAVGDLRYWRAAIMMVDRRESHLAQILAVGEALFGPPILVKDAWVWDVRRIVNGS